MPWSVKIMCSWRSTNSSYQNLTSKFKANLALSQELMELGNSRLIQWILKICYSLYSTVDSSLDFLPGMNTCSTRTLTIFLPKLNFTNRTKLQLKRSWSWTRTLQLAVVRTFTVHNNVQTLPPRDSNFKDQITRSWCGEETDDLALASPGRSGAWLAWPFWIWVNSLLLLFFVWMALEFQFPLPITDRSLNSPGIRSNLAKGGGLGDQ